MIWVNAAILVSFGLYFFLVPAAIVIYDLTDEGIREPGIPRAAVRLFRSLTPRYGQWAEARLGATRAGEVSTRNISGTEWPLFGSVFYLWSVESLQEAWEQDHGLMPTAPKVYAEDAIDAAARLVIDPAHAAWVRKHWGDDYLHTENVYYRMLGIGVYYRMLGIGALTSHAKLTGSQEHLAYLRDQVETLSAELAASPHGLLDDYPSQCYPGDVLVAIACIRRADEVLGTDHSAFAQRAIRGFEGPRLDKRGLVPYAASSRRGKALGPSRGCGNAYVSLFAPEIWPEQARKWYARFVEHFWQERWTAAGFREFPKDMQGYDWYMDVDAGPVLAGFGFAACGFGVGASRANGRFDHAFPLTATTLVVSWPLPDGTLAAPRVLSNATDAPYLGEAAILYNLTRMPAQGTDIVPGRSIPGLVYILVCALIGLDLLFVGSSVLRVRKWHLRRDVSRMPRPRVQACLWATLLVAAVASAWLWHWVAAVLLLVIQFLPRVRTPKPSKQGG